MLTELDILDHVILDEDNHRMVLIIVDTKAIWGIKNIEGMLINKWEKILKEKNLEHIICLKKKIENYIEYIYSDEINKIFPYYEWLENYSYEIRVITDFYPSFDYLELINIINQNISMQKKDIFITNEIII